MKIEQIYTGCLAQWAYYIESDGEAAAAIDAEAVQGRGRGTMNIEH